MKLLTSSLCKQGGREYNQDFLDLSVADDGACLVVCDGLGSYYGSEPYLRDQYHRNIQQDKSARPRARSASRVLFELHTDRA